MKLKNIKPISEQIKEKPWKGWLLFIGTVVIVFLLGLFAATIVERRTEAVFAYAPRNEFSQFEPRNEKWGENFPHQYDTYSKTADTSFVSKYNGASAIDVLELHPGHVILWAGYAFSLDYNQARGHYYAITDTRNTLRTGALSDENPSPQPSTCWTCKSPDVPRLMQEIGVAEFYKGSWEKHGAEIVNHIGCADCHDAETMRLKITKPALIEAFELQGKDITKASHQEMRSLVCAQCHVEYYFDKTKVKGANYLTFPWHKGMSAIDMEAYFDEIEFYDWIHPLSKAPMLKAQHPDYEMYLTGVHAARGVSCADCHMPYRSQGGIKFTDHHIQSPLNNVANSCQVCHREETKQLISDVYERQTKIKENSNLLEQLLVKAHLEAELAWKLGATQEQMQEIQKNIRHAQWRWDFSVAGHGNSFHASLETSRLISTGIHLAQEARIKLARALVELGHFGEVILPDISTKEKAQAYIGVDIEALKAKKDKFLDTIVPRWLEEARRREAAY
jgi:nitrite reductase (cytochrome c-552)